ncbi:hypothetical protein Dimus_003980, partial [Dionaea muscipula]
MPPTSHSSGRGRGQSPSDRAGWSPSDRGGCHSSTPSSHHTSSTDIDDYRVMSDYESMPTADSSHMPLLAEHQPTSSSGPTELFLDGY